MGLTCPTSEFKGQGIIQALFVYHGKMHVAQESRVRATE